MKKAVLWICLSILLLSLAACENLSIAAATPSNSPSPIATVTPALPTVLPSATPTFSANEPSADTIIIARPFGTIIGGYSDEKWLSHSEAAEYCINPLLLYEYNLEGLVSTVDSTGLTFSDSGGGYEYSWTAEMSPGTYDENGYYSFDIPGYAYPDIRYSVNPLKYTYLYSAHLDMPSDLQILPDTAEISSVVQNMLDDKFGAGNVQACVRIAVEADIDDDGHKEMVVNADNNADEFEYSYGDLDTQAMEHLWYCMCFILEDDGKVVMLDEYYSLSEEDYWYFEFFYIQNIIDLDGDGKYEIVEDFSAWETYLSIVYKYDGANQTEVLCYVTGS